MLTWADAVARLLAVLHSRKTPPALINAATGNRQRCVADRS